MANKLTVYFRKNPTFLKKGYDEYLSIIIDGMEIGRMTPGENDFLVTNGIHTMEVVLHSSTEIWGSSFPGGGTNHWSFGIKQFELLDEDFEFTVNLYYYNEESIEYGFGNIPFSEEKAKPKKGCYVATAVYGSYNCPEVWTLRRYRDFTLAKSWYGRAFIRTYYAISPTMVKWFGKTKLFKFIFKKKLDKMVNKLNERGVENTPYND